MGQSATREAVRLTGRFEQLSDVELDQFLQSVEVLTLQPGELLFRCGDPADSLALVLGGALAVLVPVAGKPDRRATTLKPGAMLGEIGLLLRVPRTATASAVSDAVVALLGREAFEAALDQGQRWANRLVLALAEGTASRLSELDQELSALIARAEARSEAAPAANASDLARLREHLFTQWRF